MKIKSPQQRVKSVLLYAVVALSFGLAALMGIAVIPGLFGYTPLVVASGSMEPTLHTGDVVVVHKVAPASLALGDVVTFRTQAGLITHRIVRIDLTPQGPMFQTKGDANLKADAQPISGDKIVAKVIYRVPRMGFVVAFANSPLGRGLLIVAPLVGLAFIGLRERLQSRQRALDASAAQGQDKTE